MNKILFVITTLLTGLQCFCQKQCRIVTTQTSIEYLQQKTGGPSSAIRTISIAIEYWSVTNSGNTDDTLIFSIASGSALAYHPTLVSTNQIIEGKDFNTDHKTKSFDISISINAISVFSDASFSINLSVGDSVKEGREDVVIKKTDEASVEAKTKYDGLKPYWIETGTNIDFVDGPKLNNFTAGIFFHKFDHGWGRKNKRWASFAGAYEAKIISSVDNLPYSTNPLVNNNSFIPGLRDTIKVFNYSGKPKQTQTIRNWSFFYSPSYRLFGSGGGSYNDGDFHLYVSLWAELRYQEIETKTDNSSLILIDSSRVPITDIGNYNQSDDTIFKSSVYSHYFGLGLPLYYETSDVNLFINPVIGFSNQLSGDQYKSLAISKENTTEGNPKWNPFYFVQFRLSEKEFGITVTGEIRGLLKKNSPPQYTIALTKKFNLQKLLLYKE